MAAERYSPSPLPESWNRATYQVYPNTFNEYREPDEIWTGRGNIRGVQEKLPYLRELGIGIVWLSPFYRSPLRDGGYDISNHTDVDPGLGTLEDVETLIAAAHELDMKILLDFVPNHRSIDDPTVQMSLANPDGPYGNYLYYADPKKLAPGDAPLPKNIVAGDRLEGLPPGYGVPNNWTSIFSLPELEKLKEVYGGIIPDDVEVPAVTAWVWHPGRQQFYLAEFSKEQPTLNWTEPAVRKEMTDVMRFWLDRGVDGFRIDVMNHIGKDPAFTDEEPAAPGAYRKGIDNPHDQWKQERMVSYWPRLKEYAEEVIAVLDEYPHIDSRLTFENWMVALGDQPDELSRLRPEKATCFNFRRLIRTNRGDWSASVHKKLLDEYYAEQAHIDLTGSVPNQVDSNHDVDRVVTRLNSVRAAMAAAVIKLTTPGMTYIYQGEEGGLPNLSYKYIPPHRRKDDDLGLRDGERSPIPWDHSTNGGFSKAAETDLWLPVTPFYHDLNLEDQTKDPRSPYSLYRAVLALRNSAKELHSGVYIPLETDRTDVLAFGRPHPVRRSQFITLANFSTETVPVAILNARQSLARVVLSSMGGTTSEQAGRDIRLDQGHIILNPNEALLLQPLV